MLRLIKNFIKEKLTLQTPPLLKCFSKHRSNNNFSVIKKFGKLHKDKIFYVIKRTPGAGLFSNVVFVLNHLMIAKKFNFIPVVDMDNYKTIYNEKTKIFNTYNAWNYYFQNVSNYMLEEVYCSNKVIITSDIFYPFFLYNMDDKNFNIFNKKNFFIKKKFIKIATIFKKKYFGKKTLGIHFRGTSYKKSAGHPLPATKKQMYSLTKKIVNEEQIDKIFLATEERDYLDFFNKKFPNKIFYINSSYRSNSNDAFEKYPRPNHRYKLGREVLIETLLLSMSDIFIYINSNVSSAALALNLNKKQKKIRIDNGFNSKNVFIASVYWYYKIIISNYFKKIKIYE